MSTEQRPFAVFDIDGTLIRWQLYHAIVDALGKDGHIPEEHFAAMKAARMQWKNRETNDSFPAYEHAVIDAYDTAVTSLTKDVFLGAAQKVFDEYKDQTYAYTRDLIRELQAKNYLLFAISASQQEIVEMLAKYYGFDAWGGSEYEYIGGRYTGNKFVLRSHEKPKRLQTLIEKFGATAKGSIGVGDSSGDIPMLEAVQQPIAMNPDKKLFQHAREQGWKIVVERKNVVYELEGNNGTYVLE